MLGMFDNTEIFKDEKIESFGYDLVDKARKNKLDPVIGREKEMNKILSILAKRTKCNPLLVGKSGVGKTAIVEGIAQNISMGKVPEFLRGCSIFALNYTSLLANTVLRGQFENRVKLIIDYIVKSQGKIILFIDEIHNIIATQKTDVSTDLANMLKQYLARDDIKLIGATTDKEVNEVYNDVAFSRRLQRVEILEPTLDGAVHILKGLKQNFERFHGLTINDDVLIETVKLSNKYIRSSYMPDKAIDLLDTACSNVKLRKDSLLFETEQIKRDISDLNVNTNILDQEKNKKINDLETLYKEKQKQWEASKSLENELKTLEYDVSEAENKLKIAESNFDVNTMIILKNSDIPKIRQQIHDKRQLLCIANPNFQLEVTKKDILKVLYDNGTLTFYAENNYEQYINNFLVSLNHDIIGQEVAKTQIKHAISKVVLSHTDNTFNTEKRFLSSLIIIGPAMSGKNTMLSCIAKNFFSSKDDIIDLHNQPSIMDLDFFTPKILKIKVELDSIDQISRQLSSSYRDYKELLNITQYITMMRSSMLVLEIVLNKTFFSKSNINKTKEDINIQIKNSSFVQDFIDGVVIFSDIDESEKRLIIDKIIYKECIEKYKNYGYHVTLQNNIYELLQNLKNLWDVKQYINTTLNNVINDFLLKDTVKTSDNIIVFYDEVLKKFYVK